MAALQTMCGVALINAATLIAELGDLVFRFNRRRTRHAAFRSLLGIAAGHPPLT